MQQERSWQGRRERKQTMIVREGWFTLTTSCTKRLKGTAMRAGRPITGATNCAKRESGAGITAIAGGMKMTTAGIATETGMTETTTGTRS